MKIAVVRGPSLNPWEMQNWLPLAKRHEMLLVGSKTSSVRDFEKTLVARPLCIGEILGQVPFGISILESIFGDPRMIIGLENLVRGYDWAVGAETRSYYSLQLVRMKKKGIVRKLAITCWENIPFLGDEGRSGDIKREAREGADLFLAVTNQARDALIAEGVKPGKIRVVPMGVDQKKFKTLFRKKTGLMSKLKTDGIIKILSVGRLVPEKGFDDILRAMAILERGKFQLTIVGEGPQEGELRKMMRNIQSHAGLKGLSGVIRFRRATYDEMPRIYNQADVFVLASRPTSFWQEQYGMVLAEAASCGLPIIAANSGACEEVLGPHGTYFTPGNFGELAKLIAGFLTGKIKPKRILRSKFDCLLAAKSLERCLLESEF